MTSGWFIQIFGWLLFIALLERFTPVLLGMIGEKRVTKLLSKLPEQDYRVIHNVMLQTNRGLTQIDHIVVSTYGVFVLETKNYQGLITGNDYSDQWTKNMYGKKYRFQNPLKQNYGHLSALKELVNLTDEKLISIVVFTENAKLKVKTKQHVINTRDLRRKILTFQNKIFNQQELNDLESMIRSLNVDTKDNRKTHVNAIQKNISEAKINVELGVCPKCNGQLVNRKGKYGSFTGCTNYPKCRFVVK